MAVVEHEIEDLNSIYGTVYEQLSQTANHSDMLERMHGLDAELNRRFQSVHTRIDAEVIPEIRNLQRRRIVRDWAASISLAVSILYGVVLTVKHFMP